MDLRWGLLLSALVLSGCAGAPPTAVDSSPSEAGSEEPSAPEGRQSRLGQGSEPAYRDPSDPLLWSGSTNVAVCVEVAAGCAGFTEYHSPSQRIPVGPGPVSVRVTVTWTAVDAAYEELVLHVGEEAVRGASPLVVELDGVKEDVHAYVTVAHDTPVVADAASQPFDGLAEFS